MEKKKQRLAKESETADLYAELHEYHVDDQIVDEITGLDDFWGLPKEVFSGKILEAGFGGLGTQVVGLLKLDPEHVYGIDLSEENVELAGKSIGKLSGKRNFSLQKASILDIPFEDGFFDMVHCRGVFQHLVDPEKGLAEFKRVLKPGGLLLLGSYGKGGLLAFFSVRLRGLARIIGFKRVKRFFSLFLSGDMLSEVLDHLFVPYEKRRTFEELVDLVTGAGFELSHRADIFMVDYAKLKDRFKSNFFYVFHRYCRNDSKGHIKWLARLLFGKSGVEGLVAVFKKPAGKADRTTV